MGIINLFSRKKAKKMQDPALVGSIAISTSGRDRVAMYIVIQQYDDIYVAVSDGKYRSVSNPKRKNVRHLQMTENRIPDKYIVRGKVVITDGEAAAILSGFCKPTDT